MFVFKDPWIIAFAALAPLVLFIALKKRIGASFNFSSGGIMKDFKPTLRQRIGALPAILRVIAGVLLVLALARPQQVLSQTRTVSDGVDIVVCLDTSTSMLAEDFMIGHNRVNRFDIVRDVVKDFIEKRKDDRIGMVAFAARAYTVCPLSTDFAWIYENLDRVKVGMIEDATAVGSALASSLNRLRSSKTKSKIVILLTDGMNNAGNISPLAAAEAAKALRIKVYTIGVGSKGLVPYPFQDRYGRKFYQNIPIEIDEDSLKRIAELTGGKYYRATDAETLRNIYGDINRLEKSNIEHFGYREYSELYHLFLVPGLLILALEILLANTILMKVP